MDGSMERRAGTSSSRQTPISPPSLPKSFNGGTNKYLESFSRNGIILWYVRGGGYPERADRASKVDIARLVLNTPKRTHVIWSGSGEVSSSSAVPCVVGDKKLEWLTACWVLDSNSRKQLDNNMMASHQSGGPAILRIRESSWLHPRVGNIGQRLSMRGVRINPCWAGSVAGGSTTKGKSTTRS